MTYKSVSVLGSLLGIADHLTAIWVGARRWVQALGASSKLDQFATSSSQLFDLSVDRVNMRLDQRHCVGTGPFSRPLQFENRCNLSEGQAGRLGIADKPQPFNGFIAVVPVPARRSPRFVEQADRLVVTNGLAAYRAEVTELTDLHVATVPDPPIGFAAMYAMTGQSSLPTAGELDAADPLASFRDEFELPEGIYLVGNSLGPLPHKARSNVIDEFDRWATLGVEGHFTGELAWKDYHELVTPSLAQLVGATTTEVVAMNALTVNLHLLMVSFYRPTPARHKIIIEDHAFPSDHFAVTSQIRQRGFSPEESLVVLSPRDGEETLRRDDIVAAIEEHGAELALVMLPGVQYYTGQVFPMADITAAAHEVGATVGFDLAHAVGNVELSLHDWDVDFAAWCSYKYLNSGPGGVGGAFVHERHVADQSLPKFHGWWGTNPDTRFAMSHDFDAIPSVDSWQLSNAPILALASLRGSLDIFDRAGGMGPLRQKSEKQIEFFDRLLDERLGGRVANLTPRSFEERGCQYALAIEGGVGRDVYAELQDAHVFCDWREPNVIRVAPVPLYNSFTDIERFVEILQGIVT